MIEGLPLLHTGPSYCPLNAEIDSERGEGKRRTAGRWKPGGQLVSQQLTWVTVDTPSSRGLVTSRPQQPLGDQLAPEKHNCRTSITSQINQSTRGAA